MLLFIYFVFSRKLLIVGLSRKHIIQFLPQELPQIAFPHAGFFPGYKHFD